MRELRKFLEGIPEELRKKWQGEGKGIDVTEELKDLMDTYTKNEQILAEQKQSELGLLVHFMRNFITAYDGHEEASLKLNNLKYKLASGYTKTNDEEEDDA